VSVSVEINRKYPHFVLAEVWVEPHTLLIYLCIYLFIFVNVEVWELITNKVNQWLGEEEAHFRWSQVENKWKNMTKKFRDCVDMNRRNNTHFKCHFYDEIADVYDYRLVFTSAEWLCFEPV
jgi:hypothetical protein